MAKVEWFEYVMGCNLTQLTAVACAGVGRKPAANRRDCTIVEISRSKRRLGRIPSAYLKGMAIKQQLTYL